MERIEWTGDPSRKDRLRAERALAEGLLVALPTETVYGIAARADERGATRRLRALKDAEPARPLTWHIGDQGALERFPAISPMARRLVARYWPGPLTLVLPGVPEGLEAASRGGWTGVRFPAQAATAALLARAPFPVVATSANRAGEPPLADGRAVALAFGEELALVLDGGPPRLGEASVVLKLGPGHFELLRPGILDLAALRSTAGLKIGFVCTGNTCRSPMAEGIARDLIARRLEISPERIDTFGFELHSMGLFAGSGAPPSPLAVEVLSEEDVDISRHVSRPATPEDIARLDRVYCMTLGHLETLRRLLPPGRDRHIDLLDPGGAEVPDPIGAPLEQYRQTAAHLRRALEERVKEWV